MNSNGCPLRRIVHTSSEIQKSHPDVCLFLHKVLALDTTAEGKNEVHGKADRPLSYDLPTLRTGLIHFVGSSRLKKIALKHRSHGLLHS